MTCRSTGFHHLHKRLLHLLSQRCLDAAPPTSRGGFVQNLHRNWAWLILIKQCKSVSFAVMMKLDATSAFQQTMSLYAKNLFGFIALESHCDSALRVFSISRAFAPNGDHQTPSSRP